MKKLFFSLAFMLGVFGQIHLFAQLDYIGYVDGFPVLENSWMNEPKILMRDEDSSFDGKVYEMTLYNEDFSLYKNLEIRNIMREATNGFGWLYDNNHKEFFVTQTFFNNDDLLEFVVSRPGTLSVLGYFAIVNENGEVLFKDEGRFSGKFMLFEIGEKRYFLARAIYTETDTFLIYEVTDGSNVSESSPVLKKIGIFPNPATDHINITYSINKADSPIMTITNVSGQTVTTIMLDPNQKQYKLDVSRYTPGTYIYSYNNSSGKFIIK